MKALIKVLASSLLFILVFNACMEEGLRGPAGPEGMPGTPGPGGDKGNSGMGNANVLKYSFDVTSADWSEMDLGNDNVVLSYVIPEDKTGNISLSDERYVAYAYAQPGAPFGYPQRKMLPYVFSAGNAAAYGVRMELLLGDGSQGAASMLAISKTTNGYNNQKLEGSEIPGKIAFEIFLIKIVNEE